MALNVKGRKTSLDEEASIYGKRSEHESEKEKLGRMNKKQKCSYFATYYLPKIAIISIIVGLIGYFVWVDIIDKPNMYFRCAVLNETLPDSTFTEFGDSFTTSIGMDADRDEASFYSYYTRTDAASEVGANTANDLSEISGRIVSGILDGMIANEEDCQNYLHNGFYQNLNEFLTTDEYNKLKKYLYIPDNSENKNHAAFGIYLTESSTYQALFSGNSKRILKPIFFIMTNSGDENKEYARKLIHYFFPEVFASKK